MGLAFPDRNPLMDVMWSALQAVNSALDGIVVQVGTVTSTYTNASTGYANPDAVTQSQEAGRDARRIKLMRLRFAT
jgi:hypothetical protein